MSPLPSRTVHLNTPLTRDSVVTRMAKDEGRQINDAVNLFNNRMENAPELPVHFDVKELGPTPVVRNKVLELIKAAGWRVEQHPNEQDKGQPGADNPPHYEVS